MALPNVSVAIENGNIGGLVATSDGTCGIVMTGATEGTVTAGTPFQVTNQAEIDALELTTGNNALAVRTLSQFLQEVSNQGVPQFSLWVMLVANTMTVASMADVTNASGAKKLVDAAGGEIRIIAVISDDTLVYDDDPALVDTNGINDDCYTAKANLHTLCTTYQATGWPMRGVVGATSFTGDATELTDLTASAHNRVSMVLGDTVSGSSAAVGMLLGRLAAVPVQRKPSRVKSGPVYSTTAYIGTVSADAFTSTTTIHDKGFITLRKFANKDGFYFTGDPTASPTTDDYHFLARGRVIDKADIIARAVFTEEVDEEVPVNADGTIDSGFAKYLEAQIEKQIGGTMLATGEISLVDAFVDPEQNVISTNLVAVVLQLTPVGYASTITISLAFSNPAA